MLPFDAAAETGIPVSADGAHVLISIPTLRSRGQLDEPTPRVVSALRWLTHHVTYLSTTGVYGDVRYVDERTPPAPRTERQRLRVLAERHVRRLACRTAILRPAAIYGPGRGVHARMRAGDFLLPAGRPRMVSRIHVDDLAAIVAASMARDVDGAFPVADESPAPSSEVARFCSEATGLPLPAFVPASEVSATRRADRRVDGGAIRQLTGVRLLYPTYREGIAACLAQEASRQRRDRA